MISAASAETHGVASLDPLTWVYLPFGAALSMLTPGAATVTSLPKWEY